MQCSHQNRIDYYSGTWVGQLSALLAPPPVNPQYWEWHPTLYNTVDHNQLNTSS